MAGLSSSLTAGNGQCFDHALLLTVGQRVVQGKQNATIARHFGVRQWEWQCQVAMRCFKVGAHHSAARGNAAVEHLLHHHSLSNMVR